MQQDTRTPLESQPSSFLLMEGPREEANTRKRPRRRLAMAGRKPGSTRWSTEIPNMPQQVLNFHSKGIKEVERREDERRNRRVRTIFLYLPSTVLSPQRRSFRLALKFPSVSHIQEYSPWTKRMTFSVFLDIFKTIMGFCWWPSVTWPDPFAEFAAPVLLMTHRSRHPS